jgi:Transketolase, N-terminal subunit
MLDETYSKDENSDRHYSGKSKQSVYDLQKMIELEIIATECRLNVLRMIQSSGHGHVGGAFSAIDMITALYFYKMRVDPKNPQMKNRDRFVLSAGHKCMAQYAVLAEKGYFDKMVLDTYGKLHSKIPGHPDMHKLPGIEANTGALGHGMALAVGMALALKLDKQDAKVYTMLGDGELAEGSNWEAAVAAAKFGLNNLIAFVDNNGLQISGKVTEVMDMQPIDEKFSAFGWEVFRINGNSIMEIITTLDRLDEVTGKPILVLAKTVKAKGIQMGENDPAYHFWTPSVSDLDTVEADLKRRLKNLKSGLKEAI